MKLNYSRSLINTLFCLLVQLLALERINIVRISRRNFPSFHVYILPTVLVRAIHGRGSTGEVSGNYIRARNFLRSVPENCIFKRQPHLPAGNLIGHPFDSAESIFSVSCWPRLSLEFLRYNPLISFISSRFGLRAKLKISEWLSTVRIESREIKYEIFWLRSFMKFFREIRPVSLRISNCNVGGALVDHFGGWFTGNLQLVVKSLLVATFAPVIPDEKV